jgi:hypothetical protein
MHHRSRALAVARMLALAWQMHTWRQNNNIQHWTIDICVCHCTTSVQYCFTLVFRRDFARASCALHTHRTHFFFFAFFFLIASHFQAQPYPTKPPKGISCQVKQELHFQCRQFQLLTQLGLHPEIFQVSGKRQLIKDWPESLWSLDAGWVLKELWIAGRAAHRFFALHLHREKCIETQNYWVLVCKAIS